MLSLTAPGLDRERYGQALQAFYSFVQGWESWAAAHVPARLAGLLPERRREPLLLRDLRFFGLDPLPTDMDAERSSFALLLPGKDSPESEAAFLGSMYVMEGSTLGGQYIARHVEETLGLAAGEGDAYFCGHGERTGAMWNAFREVLSAIPDEHSDTVIAAAKATFAYVQEKLQSHPVPLQAPVDLATPALP